MLRLLKLAHQLGGKIESAALDKAAAEPAKTQQQFLLHLLRKNAGSFFGKMHNFEQIHSETDYRRQVPVRDYEDFRPFINRIIKGEQSVLTKENPFMFTMTSGTTSEPKYVPVTRESQAYNSSLMRQWLYRAECDHRRLTAQASVGIVSRAVEGLTAAGLPFGSASGVIYKNIPWFIRRAYAIPYLVSEIEDYDERYFVLARFALASRVSFIATPNPSTLLRLAQVCADNQENLIRAIGDGTLGLAAPKQSEICSKLAAMLKPSLPRARALAHIAAKKGFLHLAHCWPDLRLVGCWLGGSVGAQADKLADFYGDVPLRDLGFMASEGHITLPFEDGTPSGILALRQNYYEFIPEVEADSAQPTFLSSDELESGRRYSILLTNAAGLYRYRLNDIIEVTDFYHRAPVIAFVRKAGEMANITGEKMHANHLLEAIDFVRRKFNLKIQQARAAPNFALSRYEIYLELEEEFSPGELLPEIDRALQRANIEYEQKRKSRRLAAPVLHLMKSGWSDKCLRRHIAAGKRDTQYKPQILCPQPPAEDAPFILRTVEMETLRASVARVFL
jgi:hypothetical protein